MNHLYCRVASLGMAIAAGTVILGGTLRAQRQASPSPPPISATIQLPGNGSIGAVAVDEHRNIYIVGSTSDPAFPTTSCALNRKCGSDGQCGASYDMFRHAPIGHPFVMKLGDDGALKFSTFLGGDGNLRAKFIRLAPDNSIYVAGDFTESFFSVPLQFPLERANITACGQYDAFVARLSSDGAALIYATCIQGPSHQQPIVTNGFDVDATGAAARADAAGRAGGLELSRFPHAAGLGGSGTSPANAVEPPCGGRDFRF